MAWLTLRIGTIIIIKIITEALICIQSSMVIRIACITVIRTIRIAH